MKIEKVVLYDREIVEIDGEFKQVKRNEKTYPALLTNLSLYVGKRDGLLDTSLNKELLAVFEVFEDAPEGATDEEYGSFVLKNMDQSIAQERINKIIYLGLIGANPKLDFDYEGFLQKYHGGMQESIELYLSLIMNLANMEDNGFKIEFEKNTSKKVDKDEKK